MIKFRQKEFGSLGNVLNGTLRGAALGGLIGGGTTNLINNGLPAYPTFKKANSGYQQSWNKLAGTVNNRTSHLDNIRTDKQGNIISSTEVGRYGSDESSRKIITTGVGMIVGAALGALVSGTKELLSKSSEVRFGSNSLIDRVVRELTAGGFEVGKDYTISPDDATQMGTKVCIVLTKDGSGLRVLINTKNDPSLKKVSEGALTTISRKAQIRNSSASDRFNEIKISTISEGLRKDAKAVYGIAKTFIQAGYPVYLIEVG